MLMVYYVLSLKSLWNLDGKISLLPNSAITDDSKWYIRLCYRTI